MALDIRNVSKTYGSFKAVDDVSFSVTPGRIFGFLGTNGAGKTTTMRLLTGALGAGNRYPLKLAAAVLMTIPVAVMFFVFQKRIISGSLEGAVKE